VAFVDLFPSGKPELRPVREQLAQTLGLRGGESHS
jgi:hypothetical protein